MKKFITLGLFILFFSMLGERSFAQAVGGGGSGGGGLMRRFTQGCTEGARSFFTIQDSGDRTRTEIRVCRNGSYMTDAEQAAYIRIPKSRCKEGARSVSQELDGDNMVAVLRICVNGKYIKTDYNQARQ